MDDMASTSYTYNNNTVKHSNYSHACILIVKKAKKVKIDSMLTIEDITCYSKNRQKHNTIKTMYM